VKALINILFILGSITAANLHGRGPGPSDTVDSKVPLVEPVPELNGLQVAWPQPGFHEIGCRSEEISESDGISGLCMIVMPSGGMITNRKEYRASGLDLEVQVDWQKEQLAFYTMGITYKHGRLDSDYFLTGIAISGDGKTLCLAFHSTFHGVCQGIAQQSEWYSHESATYALVIPATVETITRVSTHSGPDCSGIP